MKKIIELQNIKRNFQVGDETVHALRGISFTIYEGEFVTIMGTSGSGKSTLLNTLGCLDTPTSGEYLLDGVSVRTMSKPQRAVLRNRKIGFVFQNYNLLPKTTAVENVELPLMYNSSISASERRKRAIESLIAVGLGDRLEHKSNQMSGGQMQRVAIARALVNNPAVILADEATGNLDTRTSFEILVLFQKLHAEGRTLIFVTHNPEIAQYSSRNIRLRDGHVVEDTINPQILSAAAALAALQAAFAGKTVRVLAPGASLATEAGRAAVAAAQADVTVLANFVPEFVKPDYAFFTNAKRFDEDAAYPCPLILTSNLRADKGAAVVNYDRLSATDAQGGNSVLMLLRLLRLCGAAKVLLAGADGYKAGTAAYADAGLHTHTGRGAAYNAQMAGAIRAAGLPVRFITPSEYERA